MSYQTYSGPSELTLSRYKFNPLNDPEHIRILSLYPVNEQIECSLEQIHIAAGGYQALSYVWGSEDMPFRAIVRDETGAAIGYIPLTENLQNALSNLRDATGLERKLF